LSGELKDIISTLAAQVMAQQTRLDQQYEAWRTDFAAMLTSLAGPEVAQFLIPLAPTALAVDRAEFQLSLFNQKAEASALSFRVFNQASLQKYANTRNETLRLQVSVSRVPMTPAGGRRQP
jgi:hypothetical protein